MKFFIRACLGYFLLPRRLPQDRSIFLDVGGGARPSQQARRDTTFRLG